MYLRRFKIILSKIIEIVEKNILFHFGGYTEKYLNLRYINVMWGNKIISRYTNMC